MGQGLLLFEVARSHSDTPHSVGLLHKSDQARKQRPLLDNTQHSQETDIYAPGGIRTRNTNKLAAADPRLRPSGQWNRQPLRCACNHAVGPTSDKRNWYFDMDQTELLWNKALARSIVVIATITGRIFSSLRISEGMA